MSHWSIDLETLGTSANAVILSIGAAEFDLTTGRITNQFYRKLDSRMQKTRHMDMNTLDWWNEQELKVRTEAFSGKKMLSSALTELYTCIKAQDCVWGNGSSFDISILDHAYEYSTPWKFWNVRDMRTIMALAKDLGFDKNNIAREGDHHNALDDAIHQARLISAAYQHIMRGRI